MENSSLYVQQNGAKTIKRSTPDIEKRLGHIFEPLLKFQFAMRLIKHTENGVLKPKWADLLIWLNY